jgi:hypothetical protein
MSRRAAVFLVLALGATQSAASEEGFLYKAQFVQAAPGRLLELIDLVKAKSEEAPFSIRHSQGDHWDLMLLTPMGTYAEYFSPERAARRRQAEHPDKWNELVAWQEDIFVFGPPLPEVRAAFAKAGFFHLEIFRALPGRHADLLKERLMENAYLKALKRPENQVFVRDQGAGWDLFTLGFYRDLKHYAESADIPEKDQEAAAKAAGFEGASRIGPYLRTLIREHHDTLAGPVR